MMTRAEREVLEWRWFVVGGQLAVLEADCGSACLLAALSDLSPFGSFLWLLACASPRRRLGRVVGSAFLI
jgi:hypothetical protein